MLVLEQKIQPVYSETFAHVKTIKLFSSVCKMKGSEAGSNTTINVIFVFIKTYPEVVLTHLIQIENITPLPTFLLYEYNITEAISIIGRYIYRRAY